MITIQIIKRRKFILLPMIITAIVQTRRAYMPIRDVYFSIAFCISMWLGSIITGRLSMNDTLLELVCTQEGDNDEALCRIFYGDVIFSMYLNYGRVRKKPTTTPTKPATPAAPAARQSTCRRGLGNHDNIDMPGMPQDDETDTFTTCLQPRNPCRRAERTDCT